MKKFTQPTLHLPAFQSRNYRLYFWGQGLSLMGTWITQVVIVWLVYHLTQSPLLLGLVGFAKQFPNYDNNNRIWVNPPVLKMPQIFTCCLLPRPNVTLMEAHLLTIIQ